MSTHGETPTSETTPDPGLKATSPQSGGLADQAEGISPPQKPTRSARVLARFIHLWPVHHPEPPPRLHGECFTPKSNPPSPTKHTYRPAPLRKRLARCELTRLLLDYWSVKVVLATTLLVLACSLLFPLQRTLGLLPLASVKGVGLGLTALFAILNHIEKPHGPKGKLTLRGKQLLNLLILSAFFAVVAMALEEAKKSNDRATADAVTKRQLDRINSALLGVERLVGTIESLFVQAAYEISSDTSPSIPLLSQIKAHRKILANLPPPQGNIQISTNLLLAGCRVRASRVTLTENLVLLELSDFTDPPRSQAATSNATNAAVLRFASWLQKPSIELTLYSSIPQPDVQPDPDFSARLISDAPELVYAPETDRLFLFARYETSIDRESSSIHIWTLRDVADSILRLSPNIADSTPEALALRPTCLILDFSKASILLTNFSKLRTAHTADGLPIPPFSQATIPPYESFASGSWLDLSAATGGWRTNRSDFDPKRAKHGLLR